MMVTDYATLVDAVVRRRAGCPVSLPFDGTTAMMRFNRSCLFRNARGQIVHQLVRSVALRAAVGTRYPDFVTPDAGEDDTFHLRDPLTMAIFADFVLSHERGCSDPLMLRAIYRAIAEEMAALLAAPAYAEREDGLIRPAKAAGTFVSRAGLVAGLAWLHDHIAERGIGATIH